MQPFQTRSQLFTKVKLITVTLLLMSVLKLLKTQQYGYSWNAINEENARAIMFL